MRQQINMEKGAMLIELLVGLFVGVFILAGVLALFLALSKSSNDSIESIRLEHELRSTMSLMANDIRRSGYFALASSSFAGGTNNNPYMQADTDLQLPVAGCILLSYDQDSDGVLPDLNTAGGDERFGFRLNNQTIQTRSTADTSFSCTAGQWENITNPNYIQITGLTFTLNPSTVFVNSIDTSTGSVILRNISINLTGRLVKDNNISKTLSAIIRVRNDKFIPPP